MSIWNRLWSTFSGRFVYIVVPVWCRFLECETFLVYKRVVTAVAQRDLWYKAGPDARWGGRVTCDFHETPISPAIIPPIRTLRHCGAGNGLGASRQCRSGSARSGSAEILFLFGPAPLPTGGTSEEKSCAHVWGNDIIFKRTRKLVLQFKRGHYSSLMK